MATENEEITRLRAQNEELQGNLTRLAELQDEADRRARRADIEGRVSRLALEVELDQAAEVDRLFKLADADVDAEISRMRANYRPSKASPVGAGLLPIGGGVGGNALARGLSLRDLNTPPEEDTVVGDPKGARIWGEAVARMAFEAEESGNPVLVRRENQRGNTARRRDALKLAKASVRRFHAERSEVTHA